MKKIFMAAFLLLPLVSSAQTFENHFTRSLSDVLQDVEKRFDVKLKYNVDTAGLKLAYADFRVRPYSVEETLMNIVSPFDFKVVKQNDRLYKIKPYEYPRRTPADGRNLIAYLRTLYHDKASWEMRRDSLRKEVRRRLELDSYLSRCEDAKPTFTKVRQYDGYTVRNFQLRTIPGRTVCGSIYSTIKKGKHPLIICPNGHFAEGRYNGNQQRRMATLARMGAVCVDYDLYGWGESADEVGAAAHQTSEAHVIQIMNGIRILDFMLKRKDIDKTRIGVNGGSGGGTQTVLLSVVDDRYTAANPVVSLSSWFDGGCPCESGKPIQLSCEGTCNAELAAMFAPGPMCIVSDGGDWTATTPEVEFPYIQTIYGYYDAKDKVSNVHLPKEGHDFGKNKRDAVYDFFIKTFRLDASMRDESKVTKETEEQMRFNKKNNQP